MLILATFAAVALIVAGLCALLKGDTFVMAALLVVLLLIVLVVAPQAPTLHLNSAQQPVALKGVGDDSYTYVAMPMTVR